jgi:hypothetical protein
MPKISVQLEADSAEEFRALLSALYATVPMTGVPAGQAAMQSLSPQESVSTRTVEEAPEPVTVRVPEAEQPAAEAPVKAKRGRPAKTAPVEPEAAVEPAAAEPVAEPEPVKAEPVKAKPKTMPHAQPENGAASRQDLLDAFSEYVQRYGASFGFSDISSLLQKNLGDGVRKASDVPEEKLSVAIGAIKTAIADNPFNRKRDYA